MPQLQPDEAAELISGGATLLDVREPEEHAQANVPGSIFIPLRQVPERLADVPTDRPVVVMCAAGARSQQAAQFLRGHGIDARNMMHGIHGWYRCGHPVNTP